MDYNDASYKGFLLLPPVGKIILKKTWQQKFCLLFKSSKFGIQRIEVYDSADKAGQPKIITLENVIKIQTRNSTYFSIITKTAIHEFSAISEQSFNDWLAAIQSVVFPDNVSRITSIEEDNDLYCSSGEGIFNVKLHSSPVSQRCGLEEKTYTLVLTSTAIQLREELNNKLLFTWPYCYIRRYGYKSGKFTFEAGRKCETGEGTFILEHSNQAEIFRCLASKMKSMKKLLSGESTSSLLDCNDVQLQAALSMEARSRSPFPPSPINSVSIPLDSSSSSRSQINLSDIETHPKLVKPKPVKPPRRFIGKNSPSPPIFSSQTSINSSVPQYTPQTSVTSLAMSDYEPVSKYDHVEYRNEAWKTLGVDNVDHNEQSHSDDESKAYHEWIPIKNELEKIKSMENLAASNPNIIFQPTRDLASDYDKLDHFGSTNKLALGYKQVVPMPIVPAPPPRTANEYDEVQCIEAVRLADDSHLGYAVVKKSPPKGNQSPNRSFHDEGQNFHSSEQYAAIISKPKRV